MENLISIICDSGKFVIVIREMKFEVVTYGNAMRQKSINMSKIMLLVILK